MKIKIGMLCFCLLLAGSLGFLFLHAQNDSEFRMAPLNPAFLKMNEETRAGTFYMNPKFGYVPGPVDHSLFKAIAPPSAAGSFPASYDLRTYNKVNPIRDQGQCGACWAFSNTGSIESSLLPTESRNFAEQHLNKYHGFDNAECQGGGSNMAAAYFARWSGPYNETDYPYPYSSTGSWPGAGSAAVQKHVQRAVWLPNDRDTIKTFISSSSYGAVSFAFYATDSLGNQSTDAYYNAANFAFYYPTAHDTDHEIDIIGWDDNFAKTKFSTTPTNNGAWLCRNSWGTSFANAGYFWMSYYDATIADLCVYSSVQPADNYKDIYQYDPLGWCSELGNGTTTGWGANIFTATTNNPLKAISYYTTDACNVSYYIYKNPSATNPRSGTLAAQGTASFGYPAYLTTDLSAPVSLAAGDRFSVVIKFVDNSYTGPVAAEGCFANYSSGATNAAGQSFVSGDGSTWGDCTAISNNQYKYNCCIKAFTGTATTNYSLTIQASTGGTTNPVPGTYACNPGTDVSIQALPDQSCVFLGWAGDASGTANPITIHVDGNKNVTANFKLVSPPSNLTAVRLTNRSVTQTEYIVTLSWSANTANAGLNIVAYRVYQKAGDSWVNLGDLPANTLACWIRRLPKGEQTFGVASVNEGGVESARSTVVK
jgi:C1A family cysteine protease